MLSRCFVSRRHMAGDEVHDTRIDPSAHCYSANSDAQNSLFDSIRAEVWRLVKNLMGLAIGRHDEANPVLCQALAVIATSSPT